MGAELRVAVRLGQNPTDCSRKDEFNSPDHETRGEVVDKSQVFKNPEGRGLRAVAVSYPVAVLLGIDSGKNSSIYGIGITQYCSKWRTEAFLAQPIKKGGLGSREVVISKAVDVYDQ